MRLLNGEPAQSNTTISRFENEKSSEAIEGLFYQLVNKPHEMGEAKYKNLFVYGTKIEVSIRINMYFKRIKNSLHYVSAWFLKDYDMGH